MHNNLRRYIDPDKQSVIERFPLRGGSLLRFHCKQSGNNSDGGCLKLVIIYTHRAQHTNRRHTTYLVCVCVHLLHATSVGINSKTSPKSTV